jgi:hypothetical protein
MRVAVVLLPAVPALQEAVPVEVLALMTDGSELQLELEAL